MSIVSENILSESYYPRDGVHLALSLNHGIKALATTKSDFMSTSDLVDLYTCNPKLLG
jgi:predicted nucleic acid-binding protein